MMDNLLLAAHQVDFAYGDRTVLHDADIVLHTGDLVALVGPNGSGKTTLLKLLCGILAPKAGRVIWNGSDLRTLQRRRVARQIALVPQELNIPFAFTVAEIVGLGRTPHMRPLAGESNRDRLAVMQALDLTETKELADRFFGELSGGEQQRVALAMALAQIADSVLGSVAPSVLLLDEPTVHLDINHQIEILELIHKLNRERGLTVLATMHDLNLASLFFDRLILLNEGRIVTDGTPQAVLSKERVENVFHTGVVVQPHPTLAHVPHIVLLPSNGNGKH
jgi:iron complex transport system ATP-binding protein